MPGLDEVELDAVVAVGYGQVVPQAVASVAEVLEQLVAPRAADVGSDASLRGLQGIDALEVLAPRVAEEGVVGRPLLAVLVGKGIAAAVDAV